MVRSRSTLALLSIILAAFTGTIAYRLSVPAVAYFTRSTLRATALEVGLITSAFFTGRAMVAAVAGGVAEKMKLRMSFLAAAAFLANAGAAYSYAYVSDVVGVYVIRFTQGALNGLGWVSLQYLLGSLVSSSIRGRTYSIYFISGSLGGVSGGWVYSALSKEPLPHILLYSTAFFTATALLSLAAGVAAVRRSYEMSESALKKNVKGRLKLIHVVPILVVLSGIGIASAGIRGDMIYIYLKEAFELSRGTAASYVATASLVALAGNYLISWLADKVSDSAALTASSALVLGGITLLALRSLPIVIGGLVVFSIGASSLQTVSRRTAMTLFRRGGLSLGLVNSASNVGSIAGGGLTGYLYDSVGTQSFISPASPLTGFMSALLIIVSLLIIPSLPFLRKYIAT